MSLILNNTILVNSLIVFFSLVLLYQVFSSIFSCFYTFREGIDETAANVPGYQDYNPNDPLFLAKQNAGNIEVLKQRVDALDKLNPIIIDLSNNMTYLNDNMTQLAQSQMDTLTATTTDATTTVESMINHSDSLKKSLTNNAKSQSLSLSQTMEKHRRSK